MPICVGCNQDRPSFTVEHVIPETLGGRLTTPSICEDCNNNAFEEADRAIRDSPWISERIGTLEIRGKRGRLVKPKAVVVKLEDGLKLALQPSKEGMVPLDRPHPVGPNEYAVPGNLLDAVKRGYEAKGGNVVVTGTIEVNPDEVERVGEAAFDPSAWPRFTAKVILGLASLGFDQTWFTSDHASGLRRILASSPGKVAEANGTRLAGVPHRLDVNDPERLLIAPNHLVSFGLTSTGVPAVRILLFGEFRYAIEVPGIDLDKDRLREGVHWFVPLQKNALREPVDTIGLVARLITHRLLGHKKEGDVIEREDLEGLDEAIDLVFAARYLVPGPNA